MNIRIKRTALFVMLMCFAGALAYSQEVFKRNLEQTSFVPKGQWVTGVSVNYAQSNQDNYQFLIVEGIDGDTYSFKVSPTLLYIFKDNLGVGGKFTYSRSRTNLDKARVVIDSGTDYKADNFYAITQDYSSMAVFRNYISFGSSKRFGMFNEVQLELGFGQTKLHNGTGTDFTGSFADNYSVKVGVAPGMIMFLNNYSAIEVNVGVLGFSYNHTKQTTDRIYVSNWNTKAANFKINLFSISFGVAFYL